MKQLIYRRDPAISIADVSLPEGRFVYLYGLWDGLRWWASLARTFALPGAVKSLAKLATRSRQFFFYRNRGVVVHWGWVTLGRCRHYPIEKDAAVVGPIETLPSARGKGLATAALLNVLVIMAQQGVRRVYIDTAEDNVACQKAIAKAGFGPSVGSYERK